MKVRRIEVSGKLGPGVYAKDIILHIIRRLGVFGGTGFAYEYGGSAIDALSMEERMTLCNMSIEGGARVGYVNPDEKTFAYVEGRPFAPNGEAWDRALAYWKSIASDADATYDDVVRIDASDIAPTVTWGINPGQAIDNASDRLAVQRALDYMGLRAGTPVRELAIDRVFIGSCTNARIEDLRAAAGVVRGRRVASTVSAMVVPGSMRVKRQAEAEGLDQLFRDAGFEWREPGCSMCLAMNPDKLVGAELCASSSNRNFKGRQGSPTGRTILMSPVMVAAAAVRGAVADARDVFDI